MQDGSNAKQLIVERIKQSNSILVAVSANPSVDALSAALGLALMLNKIEKHTTAVFSGTMPPAMQFLQPERTFENSVDALRDFIISLDKEKADRLRYKVEDDVVRIFITPYRTTITEKDLQFSQGDFNVDLIIALGVDQRDDLDRAIVAHGRILHDATVITINANNQRSGLGAVDWHDPNASSLCEMLVSISESFQQPGLLDTQISTALLTGIVAATERFSNQHTTPRVMTMAAQLMAAGANQQLIATQLGQANAIPQAAVGAPAQGANTQSAQQTPAQPQKKADGELDIVHESNKGNKKKGQTQQKQPKQASSKKAQPTAEQQLAAAITPPPQASVQELKQAIEAETTAAAKQEPPLPQPPEQPKAPGSTPVNGVDEDQPQSETKENAYISSHGSWKGRKLEPPTLGGTLNATAEQALADAKRAEDKERNQTLLAHPHEAASSEAAPPTPPQAPPKPEPTPAPEPEPPQTPPAPQPPAPQAEPIPTPTPTPPQAPVQPEPPAATPAVEPYIPPPPPPPAEPKPESPQPAAESPQDAAANLDAARQAVNNALASQPFNPANQPLQSVSAQPLPSEQPSAQPGPGQTSSPDAPSAPPNLPPLPPLPPMPPLPQADVPAPLPPAPDLPGLHDDQQPPESSAPNNTPNPPAGPQNQGDPGQFKIPGSPQ